MKKIFIFLNISYLFFLLTPDSCEGISTGYALVNNARNYLGIGYKDGQPLEINADWPPSWGIGWVWKDLGAWESFLPVGDDDDNGGSGGRGAGGLIGGSCLDVNFVLTE